MPTTQPATYTPCPPQRKALRKALPIQAPKKKKNNKPKSRLYIETVKCLLEHTFNKEDVKK